MKICYLEDEPAEIERLKNYLTRFQAEQPGFQYVLETYDRAFKLLDAYRSDVDLIFLDIQVPDMMGIDAARRIRDVDQEVMIIFVTNLTQYAIDGNSVRAWLYSQTVELLFFQQKAAARTADAVLSLQ